MNPGKFQEFRSLLASYPDVELVPAEGIIRNPEKLAFAEIYSTYLENAVAKARLANQGCHYPILSDDSGLEVDALGGAPGVRSHRYAKPETGKSAFSKAAQDEANIQLMLNELAKRPGEPRTAKFVATLVLMVEGICVPATGILEGTIAEAPRGGNGFGYDPIFIPKGSTKTLAEMTENEKNAISHRGRAIHELMAQIKARGIVFAKP